LHLGNSRFTRCRGAAALAAALKQNTCLQVLRLVNNRINVAGVTALATMLQRNATLKELHLSGNRASSAGAIALAAALRANETLQVLSLDGCCIGAEGILALMEVISENHPSLRELRIRGNNTVSSSVEDARVIGAALKKNRMLSTLLVGFNDDDASDCIPLLRDAMKTNITLTNLIVMQNQSRQYSRDKDIERFLKENRFRTSLSGVAIADALLPQILAKSSRVAFEYDILRSRVDGIVAGLQAQQERGVLPPVRRMGSLYSSSSEKKGRLKVDEQFVCLNVPETPTSTSFNNTDAY